jgi:DNA-binding MltR family transcriptional regulator
MLKNTRAKRTSARDRIKRGNQMLEAMKKETDRGKACVGDAMLDELFKELFEKRLVDDQQRINEMIGSGQPLANYGVRLKLAYLLGWIGPQTYATCHAIHKMRNAIAHSMDVDSFSHPQVNAWFEKMSAPTQMLTHQDGRPVRVNIARLEDRFLVALTTIVYSGHHERPFRAS